MMSLRFKSGALQELNEAVAAYEQLEPGLGTRFAREIFNALELTLQFPQMHPEFPPGVRRIILRRFPFTICYRLSKSALTVQAVLHSHVNPGTRDTRLKDE